MKNDEEVVKKSISGVVWKFAEKAGTQLMQLVIQIVLARLLLPEDYGLVGLLSIFIAISDVFIMQGLTTALIQKKDADDVDFSSVFFANIGLSVLIYGVLFAISPSVALFYEELRLTSIMRVLSLNVIIGAFCAVHNAIMSRMLDFKKSFFRNLANTVTQGITGVLLALAGAGVWSIVFSKIAGTFVGAIVLGITVKWVPQLHFSMERIRVLFSYSSKILGTNLLNTTFNNLHSLVIGKVFNKTDLGYYQRGQQIPQAAMMALDGSLNEVLYSALSRVQDDRIKLKSMLRRSMKISMFIVMPAMLGLLAVAEPLTLLLLTERWLPSVPFMQLSCIVCLFWPLSARIHALNAIGRSDITFRLSLVSKGLTLIFIVVCIPFGIYAIMVGTILTSCINLVLTSHYVNKYIQYSLKEMLGDLLPTFVSSTIMTSVVFLIGRCIENVFLTLCVQVICGVLVYLVMSLICKNDSLFYLYDFMKNKLKK